MSMILYVLAALLMLGVMVLVHECGHFFASRLTGIPVRQFGIGMGPSLVKWKSKKHETTFVLRLIPVGGYCMYYGEDDPEGGQKGDARNLSAQGVWRRLFAILMGPGMNFVLAFLVAVITFAGLGAVNRVDYNAAVIVNTVAEDGPAANAGMLPGDLIIAVNGQDAKGVDEAGNLNAGLLIGAYQPGDPALVVTLQREDTLLDVSVSPRYDETEGRMLVGITMAQPVKRVKISGPGMLMSEAFAYCVDLGGSIIRSLGQMFTSGENLSRMGSGPVGIVVQIAESTRDGGLLAYVSLLIIISVNLGLVNLLPIPGLDGSRVIFLLIEAVRRKPVPQKIEAYVHLSGYVLLFGLIIFFTYNDILRIFGL